VALVLLSNIVVEAVGGSVAIDVCTVVSIATSEATLADQSLFDFQFLDEDFRF
jgi:hypothetical protein